MSFNRIIIVGYLGRDPELRLTPQGHSVCSFSIASTEKRAGEEITTWFKVTAWNRLAEIANEYLHKGSQAYICGSLRLTEYTDREGQQRTSLEVRASEIQFLGTRNGDEDAGRRSSVSEDEANSAARKAAFEGQGPAKKRGAKQATLPGTTERSSYELGDDEIPF